VRCFGIQEDWLIIATNEEVLFAHLYRLMDKVIKVEGIEVQAMNLKQSKRAMLFEGRNIHIYEMKTDKAPVLISKSKMKQMEPYSMDFKKSTAVFGGVNYSSVLNNRLTQKEILVVEDFNAEEDRTIQTTNVLSICKKAEKAPIENLSYLSKIDLFICSCAESVFLFHLESRSLIASVDLTSPLAKMVEIEYPINLANFLVKTSSEKALVRISFEQYGSIVGAEVSKVDKYREPKDFFVEKKEVYTTDGELVIHHYDDQKERVLYGRRSE
jgi:hypothetical protein